MRLLRLTLPIALLALLSACVPTPAAAPTPTDAATEAPLFATDEEALAAAEEVYREYLRVTSAVMDGSADVSDLEEVLEGSALEDEKEGVQKFRNLQAVSTGDHEIVSFSAQSVDMQSDPLHLQVYICEDISKVKVVDSSGTSLVAPDRAPRYLMLVRFDSRSDGQLRIASREVWDTKC